MNEKINVAIVGYGNLGRGSELAVNQQKDMHLFGVFTRRDPASITPLFAQTRVYPDNELADLKDQIDVLVLCAGSATDLPEMTPALARDFNLVDSFDTHANIPAHFAAVDAAAKAGGRVAIISVGWDPGLFSLNRALARAVLPNGTDYTFWGSGVSQGHSEAVRQIAGVVDARQYTIPVEAAIAAVRAGETPELSTREKHTRLVYVVAAKDADTDRIEREIVTMPNYFADYDTSVRFISEEEMASEHSSMPHGGSVFRVGKTGLDGQNAQVLEYRLALQSNPEFTSSVLVAYARAAWRLSTEGASGCRTVFDIAPAYLLDMGAAEMRAELL
ncbi:MAG: diaminopimelate dehydrogenase [Coriobacteriia bacterium]|nr:diaminopimelate dehydrogenase [Coriobacteriia bacterium]